MSRLKESARQLSSRITVIWHSLLSWMHWSRRRRLREQAQMREQIRVLLLQERVRAYHDLEWKLQLQEVKFRELLLEALRPVAEAMQRQDSQHQASSKLMQDLQLEILNSLQPSAEEQISQRIGLPQLTR